MNNKWIVPIVAIMLCAVSLIGAGYAAYTATLTDTETQSVENDYTILTIGTHTVGTSVYIEYDSNNTATNGVEGTPTYTAHATEITLLTFDVDADTKGTKVTTDADEITVVAALTTNTNLTNYFGTVTLTVEDGDGNAVTTLNEGTTYTVVLNLAGPISNVSTQPEASGFNIEYTLTLTDDVADTA